MKGQKSMKYKIVIFSVLLFLLSLETAFGQTGTEDQKVRIDSVIVIGNQKTHTEVILREIPFQLPDTLSRDDLMYIQKRLMNLYLFERVEMGVFRQGEENVLVINVTEHWYLFPIPLLFINERDWSKLSYGLQLIHQNFRGMNEKLTIGGWLGYNPAFSVKYYNPWLGRKSRFILGLSFFTGKVANKFFDFDEQHIGGRILFGKRLNLDLSVQTYFEFRRVHLPSPFESYSISKTGNDLVPKIGIELRWDRRDLFEYPLNGFYIQWNISKTGFSKKQPRFTRFIFDNRLYFKVYKNLYLGSRNYLNLNTSKLPIYDAVFIGYNERIRGYFNRVFTARNLMIQTFEFRFQLLKPKYFSLKGTPLPGFLAQNLKFGVNLAAFMDTGTKWNLRKELRLKKFYSGAGVGIHFNLPYNSVLRIDHAWNDRGRGEWIIDGGVWF